MGSRWEAGSPSTQSLVPYTVEDDVGVGGSGGVERDENLTRVIFQSARPCCLVGILLGVLAQ